MGRPGAGRRRGHGWAAALALAGAGAALAAAGAAWGQAPSVEQLAPADGAMVNATALDASGQARVFVHALMRGDGPMSPAGSGVWLVALPAGGTLKSFELNDSAQGQGALEVGAWVALADGAYTLVAVASDAGGNTTRAESSFVVDTRPPTLQVSAPSTSPWPVALVSVDARDAATGVALPIILSYKSACASAWTSVAVGATQLPGRALAQAELALCEGTNNQFSVSASDKAGNTAAILQRRIAYDTQPPRFTTFAPRPFERVGGENVSLEAWVADSGVGVDAASVAVQWSTDGGTTWGPWSLAGAYGNGTTVRAHYAVEMPSGATVAVRWRAQDLVGNGPAQSRPEYFYVNGAPFVVSFEPAQGAVLFEHSTVRLAAEFADPDADSVRAWVASDRDGPLGPADGRLVVLTRGFHNLTLTGDDGHGHVVSYTYMVEVAARPAPDSRPLVLTAVLAGAMVLAAYASWTKEEEDGAPPGPPAKP